MKFFTQLRNRLRKNLLKNQSGQGATEYILLLVVVVAVVMMFKGKIKAKLDSTIGELEGKMSEVTSDN
jgi:Flp pilus assembly pilin Flp